jgi:hypothetical protein
MQVLCEGLYRRLEERFGRVLVANEGAEFRGITSTDFVTGRPHTRVVSAGEEYRVCCPKCGDTRHRLYIGHRLYDFPHLVHCFNEDCYDTAGVRRVLYNHIFHSRRPARPAVIRGRSGGSTMGPVSLPGTVVPVGELPAGHPAREYLVGRGFDPVELSRQYSVGYCTQAEAGFTFPFWRGTRRIARKSRGFIRAGSALRVAPPIESSP